MSFRVPKTKSKENTKIVIEYLRSLIEEFDRIVEEFMEYQIGEVRGD